MNAPERNDPIDTLLCEQSAYVEDGGFTARVVKSLPRRRALLRPIILLGATAIGSVLAILWLPWRNLPVLNWPALLSFSSQVWLPWMLVLAVIASLIWGVIAAVQWED